MKTHFTSQTSPVSNVLRPQKCFFINSEHTNTPSTQIFKLSESPPACLPGAAKPSFNNSNHCLCQLTSSGRSRQMWVHQHCPDSNCFYQPSLCECLVVATGSLQHACLPAGLIFYILIQFDGRQHLNSQERLIYLFIFLQLPLRVYQSNKRNATDGNYTL